jgi:two-component system phosphate regulon response regulator OmpR
MIAPIGVRRGDDRRPSAGPTDSISTVLVGCGRVTHALGGALEKEGVRAFGFERAEYALDEIRRFPPSLVIVGTAIADLDPYSFLGELRRLDDQVGVLFLSEAADRGVAMQALMHGADDVLPPPHSVSAILLRAQVVTARNRLAPEAATPSRRMGRFELDVTSRRVLDDGRPVALTGREFELLVRLIEARGRVVSREELLDDIWGGSPSEGVLDATIHRLRKKLEANLSEPRFVTTVRGIGYRLEMGALGATV